jgi:hypothetical protein
VNSNWKGAFALSAVLSLTSAAAFAGQTAAQSESANANAAAQTQETDSAKKKKSVTPGPGMEERQRCEGDPDALACEPGQTRRCVSGEWTCVDIPARPQ